VPVNPTPVVSIVLFVVAGIFGALGQYLYKTGADAATGGVTSYLVNPRLVGGVFCYVAVMILFVGAFKRGGSMAVLYPVYATTFIWGAVISHFAFGTEIRLIHVVGMGTIVGGMYLLGR
jgi:multidrug transporter EmrE-like cation transporter